MPLRRIVTICIVSAVAALAACGTADDGPDPVLPHPWLFAQAGGLRTGGAATPSPAPAYRVSANHPRILLSDRATRAQLVEALTAHSPAASRFQDHVSQQLLGRKAYAFQPWFAALMYQLTADVRYARYAIDETDQFVAAEEQRIAGNQRAKVSEDSYLEVGQLIGNVALVYDWCNDQLTPDQRQRWMAYANQTVWNVWNPAQARWGNAVHAWTGWSVNNPANNYYYSFLKATMLVGLATHGENPQAQQWLEQFRLAKIENQLLPTFSRDLQGGGSREGTGYGTAMKGLWQLYDWWERSTGDRIASRTPHTLASMAHLIHSIVPTLDRLAPTGDHSRDSAAMLFDYHREYLLGLMALYPNERLSGVASSLLEASSVPQMRNGFMFVTDFLYERSRPRPRALSELATVYWGPGTGQLMMRSAWEPSATYANFICGPYTESHAHRDQGSFVIYKGTWLALDANMLSHSGIEQDEALHNLVRFEAGGGAVRQSPNTSCRLAALADTPLYTYASAVVTPVYGNRTTVTKSEREFLFIKPDTFVVFDRAAVNSRSTRRVWTLNVAGKPKIDGDLTSYSEGVHRLDVHRVAPAGLQTETRNWPELNKEVRSGVRVDAADGNGIASEFLHVLSTGGTVASATRSDAPGQTGTEIKFADGRTAIVRFSTQGLGGTLDLRASDRSAQFSGALPTSVVAPPLFVKE